MKNIIKRYNILSFFMSLLICVSLIAVTSCDKNNSQDDYDTIVRLPVINLKDVHRWHLASTPQHQTSPGMFPEGALHNDLAFRYNFAHLNWFVIDPLFTSNTDQTPAHIANDLDQLSFHYIREVLETEIWSDFEYADTPLPIPVFNMVFYPNERGPYNYDAINSDFSSGIAQDGSLIDPHTRWGGIMRSLQETNFEEPGIEYITFWLMDPFIYNQNHSGGDIYINLGEISEDVLRDGRSSFENGLPVSENVINVDTTFWGRIPTIPSINPAFDNNPNSRIYQDVGLDGLSTEDERSFFSTLFLDPIAQKYGTNSQAFQKAFTDPSADNYKYFRGSDLDANEASIIERYKRYNGLDGNSPTAENSPEYYPTHSSVYPDLEDINWDGILNETERYFQYQISLRPEDMVKGTNFITEIREATVHLRNNQVETVRWYYFRIPLKETNYQVIGNINDFSFIPSMRIFFKGFSEPIFCRFATLELVRKIELN